MKIARTTDELRNTVKEARSKGLSIGLVPTMGALHAGHRSIIERARRENDFVVVSVFVNPTQFNNPNDLATYPRTEEADIAMLEEVGVDLAFIPTVEAVYGNTPDTRVFDLGPVAEVMEGARRPGHFNGVAQIVSRLFEWSQPTRAYFGQKDFQQIAVIRRMAQIEGFDDIDIVACPIIREKDGLALSSRNVRLTPEHRAAAPAIFKTLGMARAHRELGGMNISEVKKYVIDTLNALPGVEVEYFEIVDAQTMQPVDNWYETSDAVGCITVWFGDVRLIDNVTFDR